MAQHRPISITLTVWNNATEAPALGAAGTLLLQAIADNAAPISLAGTTVEEIGGGEYRVTLSGSQNFGVMMTVAGTSSDEDLVVVPAKWQNEPAVEGSWPTPGVSGTPMSDPNALEAEVPAIDGCPVLTRLKCFVTQVGIVPTLQHVVRNRKGAPLNLHTLLPDESQSEAEGTVSSRLMLRAAEIVSGERTAPINGRMVDASNGVIAFDLNPSQVAQPGVYQLSIGVADMNDRMVSVENPILLVEKSLFGTSDFGPPTIQEVRQAIMDAGAAENLLLDDVEFSDDQIAFAFARPIRRWNDTPPPLRPAKDTRDFPFPDPWLDAICGHLFTIAAHNYRRNKLAYSAGGVSVDDKNKEPEYFKAGQMLLEKYDQFVQYKKVEINTALFVGSVGSIYGGLFH